MKDNVLVDTSVWIEFFRKRDSVVSGRLKELLIENKAAVTGIILTELYRGVADKNELEFLKRFIPSIHYILMKEESYKDAGIMGYNLSKRGINIRIVDLLIAQVAMDNNIFLYTLDSHLKVVARHSPLLLYR